MAASIFAGSEKLRAKLGLAAGLVYAAVRVAMRGNARALVAIVGFLAVVTAVVALTPLERYVGDRLAHQHSNERRESLVDQAVAGALERPLLGYGGPRESPDLVNAPEIGTHGQVYLVIFSQGIPGLVFFAGWWLWVLWMSRKAATGPPWQAAFKRSGKSPPTSCGLIR